MEDKKKKDEKEDESKLKPCQNVANPEMVRNEDDDEPCDDSRG